jgi:sigma-B regulation protein RsbU (phosphoserine phosphatase)
MLDQALEGSGGGRAYLVLRMDGGALGARAARAARGEVATTQDRNVSRELAFAVMSERKPRLDPLGSRPAMCAPLIVRGAPAGVLYVDAQPDEAAFVEADLELIAAIASSAALVIDNERLASRASTPPAPASLSQGGGSGIRPLPTATPLPQDPATLFREVRQGLIPRALPRPAGWDIASRCRLARGPTGDFHDFVETPNGRAGILVADVSDRESPAGLFTAAARTAARASLAQATSPADAIGRLNALIGRDVTRGSSLTLSYAEIDPLSGDLAYVNAGHLPPMFFRASQGQLFSLAQTGGVVSGDPNATFDQRTVRCQPGDFLVMITDGVTSAAGASREPFGWDRLQRIAFEQRLAPAAQLAAVLESAIGSFVGMAEPSDDLTIVVARRV